MRTAEQIIEIVEQKILNISERPAMYGCKPQDVDSLLLHIARLWAEIVDREEDFYDALMAVSDEAECGVSPFSHCFMNANPDAADSAILEFVLSQWAKIMASLGVPFAQCNS